jgi:hypothetical protein
MRHLRDTNYNSHTKPTQAELEKAVAEIDEAAREERGEPPTTVAGVPIDEIAFRLEEAVMAGKLPSILLSEFNSFPFDTLARIPADVAQAFKIPTLDPDSGLVRSHAPSFLPWWKRLEISAHEEQMKKSGREKSGEDLIKTLLDDAGVALEKAVSDGALDSRVLSDFNVRPLWTIDYLQRTEPEMCKSYNLPVVDEDAAAAQAPYAMRRRGGRPAVAPLPVYQPQSSGPVEHDSLSKSELREAESNLQRAVVNGLLPAWMLGSFPVRPLYVLGEVDEEIARQYELPRVSAAAAASQAPRRH